MKVPKKINLFRWIRYRLRKERIESIKVFSDIQRKKAILNNYIVMAQAKFDFIKDVSLFEVTPDRMVSLGLRFTANVEKCENSHEFKVFEEMFSETCRVFGYSLGGGWSCDDGDGGGPQYFFSVSEDDVLRALKDYQRMGHWGFSGQREKYDKAMKTYLTRYAWRD